MSGQRYLREILPLLKRLGDEELPSIQQAGAAIAESITRGHRVWVAKTSHCLHTEAFVRSGGFVPVHVLDDYITIQAGDTVIEGTPVGTASLPIEPALICKERGATLVVMTNVTFELDPNTELQHPTKKRLHELADILIDLKGAVGDGVMELQGTGVRIIPHSGVTSMVALWMMFGEAMALMSQWGYEPFVYQNANIIGARTRNNALVEEYRVTGVGCRLVLPS